MPALPTNDLRSEARLYQRDKAASTKWNNGSRVKTGYNCPHNGQFEYSCNLCPSSPINWGHNPAARKATKANKQKLSHQTTTIARKAFRNELDDAFDGPVSGVSESSDEEVHDASAAPLPTEADYMYSYDHQSGPAEGRDVLSSAITKAVQRFENNETEKLVKKEYDLIDEAKEGYIADEDDDFEVIEHSHLK